jgi:hypothetical protein
MNAELNATFVSMIEVAYPLFVVLFSFLFPHRAQPVVLRRRRPHHGGYDADHL